MYLDPLHAIQLVGPHDPARHQLGLPGWDGLAIVVPWQIEGDTDRGQNRPDLHLYRSLALVHVTVKFG